MAMRKERAHRYQSASELGNDIRNYLEGNTLVAGPESASYRIKKFVRKHKGQVVAATALACVLLVSLVAITAMYFRAELARQNARRELYRNKIALADNEFNQGNIKHASELLESCPEDLQGW